MHPWGADVQAYRPSHTDKLVPFLAPSLPAAHARRHAGIAQVFGGRPPSGQRSEQLAHQLIESLLTRQPEPSQWASGTQSLCMQSSYWQVISVLLQRENGLRRSACHSVDDAAAPRAPVKLQQAAVVSYVARPHSTLRSHTAIPILTSNLISRLDVVDCGLLLDTMAFSPRVAAAFVVFACALMSASAYPVLWRNEYAPMSCELHPATAYAMHGAPVDDT